MLCGLLILALCGVLASGSTLLANERAGLAAAVAPVASPLPLENPHRDLRGARSLPDVAPGAVAQCEGSAIFARPARADGTRAFFARFSPEFFARQLDSGCTRMQRGCNSCIVTYSACDAVARASCDRDGACLAEACTRRVICTGKVCSAQGQATPLCDSRIARTRCLAYYGDEG